MMAAPMVPRKEMRAELYMTDRWVRVHDGANGDIRESAGQLITHGASSQDRVVPPALCNAVLENSSERYSRRNPLSPNYGKLGANQPYRVSNGLTADGFSRTASSSWGISPYGDLWSQFQSSGTAADFAVSAGIATHTINGTSTHRLSYMPGQLHRNVRVSIECRLSFTNVTGADLEPANIVIRGLSTSDYIMVRVVITTAEVFTLQIRNVDGTLYGSGAVTVPSILHTASTWFKVVAEAESGTVRAKLYLVDDLVDGSDGEPLDWTIEAAVPVGVKGWVGVRSGVALGNTNIPVTFNYRNFEVRSPRFIGEAAVMSPKWDLSERGRTVSLQAAGITRRLGQGSPVLKSTLRRVIPSVSGLVQYWPMEDGAESGSLASAIVGAPAMMIDGDHTLAAYDGFASSEPIPTLGATIWRGNVPPYPNTGAIQTRWIMHAPEDPLPDGTLFHRVWCSGGSIAFWDVSAGAGGGLKITANTGSAEVLNNTVGFDIWDRNVRMSLELVQNGSDIDWSLSTYEVNATSAGGFGATLAGHTLGIASQVCFSLNGDLNGTAIGHATVETAITSVFALRAQLNAYNGETAMARMGRLCFEEGVPLAISGEYDPDALMGPQRVDTLLSLLGQCADVDQGILGESKGLLGLRYRTRLSMINQSVALTLDRSAGELAAPFGPTDDDRLTLNDVTANRINGSSYRVEQLTGPMSVQDPPAGAGRVDAKPDFAAYWDVQLPHLAGWMVSLGTVDEYRIPSVVADMSAPDVEKNLQLVYDILSLDVGDLVAVTGLSPIGIYDDIRQLARGYSEAMLSTSHKISANTFPYAPYDALVLDDATLGRLDPDTSSVTTEFSATATSFSVSTSDAQELWTTDVAEFPMDVMIAGERIRISAISGATSPQTFTVATSGRSINGVEKSHLAGESVHLFNDVHLA